MSLLRTIALLAALAMALPALAQRNDPDSVRATKKRTKWERDLPTPQDITTVVKTSPTTILWGAIPFTAEYKLGLEFANSRSQASQFTISYFGKSPFVALLEQDLSQQNGGQDFRLVVQGARLQLTHKFYLNGFNAAFLGSSHAFAPKGFYIAPHVSYATATISDRYLNRYDIYIRGTQFNIAGLVGFQAFVGGNISMEGFFGLGYKRNEWIERYDSNNIQPAEIEFGGLYDMPVKIYLGYTIGFGF